MLMEVEPMEKVMQIWAMVEKVEKEVPILDY